MIKYQNECVDCPPEMGCLGSSCPYRNVRRVYCDKCGHEEDVYEWGDEEWCFDCILEECGEDVDEDELKDSLVKIN